MSGIALFLSFAQSGICFNLPRKHHLTADLKQNYCVNKYLSYSELANTMVTCAFKPEHTPLESLVSIKKE